MTPYTPLTDDTGRIGRNPVNAGLTSHGCDAFRRSKVDEYTPVFCRRRRGLKLYRAVVNGVTGQLATLCDACGPEAEREYIAEECKPDSNWPTIRVEGK